MLFGPLSPLLSSASRWLSRLRYIICACDMGKISLVRLVFVLALAGLLGAACGSGSDREDELRSRVEALFEATLNGDVAALSDLVSDQCTAKAEFLEEAGRLRVLDPVEVVLPEGTLLFDFGEGGVAVAKRARDGPPVLIDGTPVPDDPASNLPMKLEQEDGDWRLVNCGVFIAD